MLRRIYVFAVNQMNNLSSLHGQCLSLKNVRAAIKNFRRSHHFFSYLIHISSREAERQWERNKWAM